MTKYDWIRDLPLSVRSKNSVARSGVESIHELAEMTEERFLLVKNTGKVTLLEVRNLLKSMGLNFGHKTVHESCTNCAYLVNQACHRNPLPWLRVPSPGTSWCGEWKEKRND